METIKQKEEFLISIFSDNYKPQFEEYLKYLKQKVLLVDYEKVITNICFESQRPDTLLTPTGILNILTKKFYNQTKNFSQKKEVEVYINGK